MTLRVFVGTLCAAIFYFASLSTHAVSVTYTYSGPVFTGTGGVTGADPLTPLYEGLSITGSFTTEELLPSTSTDFLGALPGFSFSDGVRTISNASIVPGPGDITGPLEDEFYVNQFTIITDSSGDISAWYIQFINNSLVNALSTYQNGTGADATRLTPGLHDCVDGAYCGGSVNTSSAGLTGTWSSSAAVVPVPAALWLYLSCIAGFAVVRQNRSKI